MKQHPVYAPLAGFCMIAIGLCLVRYAYTPLIPSLIDAKWLTKAGAGYLSGFNCLGYLLGCVAALFLPVRVGVRLLLRVSLVLAVVGQVMSAWDFGFAYLAVARGLTGMAGASLVILTPSVVLPHVPDAWKKVASGICFTGAGGAIVLVCLALPYFLAISVTAGWLFEAGLTAAFAVLAWPLTASASPRQVHRRCGRHAPKAWGANAVFLDPHGHRLFFNRDRYHTTHAVFDRLHASRFGSAGRHHQSPL